jgi:hypothetical protein
MTSFADSVAYWTATLTEQWETSCLVTHSKHRHGLLICVVTTMHETELYGANNTEQIKLSLSLGDWPCEWRIWNDVVALLWRKWRHIHCFSPSCASAPPFALVFTPVPHCQQVVSGRKNNSLDRRINAKLSRGWSGDRRRWSNAQIYRLH